MNCMFFFFGGGGGGGGGEGEGNCEKLLSHSFSLRWQTRAHTTHALIICKAGFFLCFLLFLL